MNGPFMGLGGIADEMLLRSGREALAIGFPLDGPVRDAVLMCLYVQRHAHKIRDAHEYIEYLHAVNARYPAAYAQLANDLVVELQKHTLVVDGTPLTLRTL